MQHHEYTPEEKLLLAIFGEGARERKHFLTPEGKEALHQVLARFIATDALRGARGVRVLRLRFGFEPRTEKEKLAGYPSDARTLQEVAVYFNRGRERIRQIEATALRLLRHPRYSRELRQFLP